MVYINVETHCEVLINGLLHNIIVNFIQNLSFFKKNQNKTPPENRNFRFSLFNLTMNNFVPEIKDVSLDAVMMHVNTDTRKIKKKRVNRLLNHPVYNATII